MLELFTEEARRTVVLAQEETRDLGHPSIGTEHLLLGLLRQPGRAADVLAAFGVRLDAAREAVRREAAPATVSADEPARTFTRGAKKAMEYALRYNLRTSGGHIGTEHLLLGALADESEAAVTILGTLGLAAESLRESLLKQL